MTERETTLDAKLDQLEKKTEKLAKEGGDPREVITEFLEFIRGSLIVGHNVSFDLSILLSETERLGLSRPDFAGWYDTLDIYRRFYPRLTNHKLESLGAYIKVSHPSTHDAFRRGGLCLL